jgi:hypothetical protein
MRSRMDHKKKATQKYFILTNFTQRKIIHNGSTSEKTKKKNSIY